MKLLDLPVELITHIVEHALVAHSSPSSILAVHSIILNIGLPILHRTLQFSSIEQMEQFSSKRKNKKLDYQRPPISRVPESIWITLPGGLASKKLWTVIEDVFIRCRAGQSPRLTLEEDEQREEVKHVHFTLNSLASDPNLHLLHQTMGHINPTTFTWTGPDPDHNFSCAIVPAATDQVFKGLSTWSNLRSLTLCSISFSRCAGRSLLLLTPFTHPLLRTITLQQVVFLHPASIAACSLQLPMLEEFRCIDVYQESIYGPRVRITDVERSFEPGAGFDRRWETANATQWHYRSIHLDLRQPPVFGIDPELGALEGRARVRQVVRCEAKVERLLGGDREMA